MSRCLGITRKGIQCKNSLNSCRYHKDNKVSSNELNIISSASGGLININKSSEVNITHKYKTRNNSTKKDEKLVELRTEDLGKIFEMAICLLYGTEYRGKFKYNMESAENLKNRLYKLKDLFPQCIHTAERQCRYDFTASEGLNNVNSAFGELTNNMFLSAKTTKKDGKIAPQVIGQTTPHNFYNIVNKVIGKDISQSSEGDNNISQSSGGDNNIDNKSLKKYIQENIVSILPIIIEYTFDVPIIYYNQYKDTIRYIVKDKPINWSNYEFQWTRDWNLWNNSTGLKIVKDCKTISIMEFQFHSKSRSNIVVRWYFENLLDIFTDNFKITII